MTRAMTFIKSSSLQVFTFAALLLLAGSAANAQSIRVNGLTTARYIDVKPISTQDRVALVPLTQDLNVNVWGFGTGMRLYAEVRGRASAGDNSEIWPQSDDNFDVIAAYAELDRKHFRVRGGRQWKASPLGFYNYDGASLLIRPARAIRAELFGGWSLLAGESDDFGAAVVGAIEPFKDDEKRNIFGGQIQLHLAPRINMSALYQREVRADRAGLYSERVAGDASFGFGTATLLGGVETDLAADVINEARVQLSAPLFARITGSIEARRYRPYFDLWTIWGFFNPIGFKEALANARWSNSTGTAALHIGGGVRSYDDDDGGVEFERLREDGWRAVADVSWTPKPVVTLSGAYRADIGFGASRSQGDISARLNIGERGHLSASALAFQSAHELQVREGTVYGFGTDAALKVSPTSKIGWSMAVYRHDNATPTDEIDWSQMRGSVWLEWTVGSNPDVPRIAQGAK